MLCVFFFSLSDVVCLSRFVRSCLLSCWFVGDSGCLFGQEDFQPSAYEESPMPHSFQEQLEGLQQVVQAGTYHHRGKNEPTQTQRLVLERVLTL